MNDPLLTRFPVAIRDDELPGRMPSPFAHTPHPLAQHAARVLQQRLEAEQPRMQSLFMPDGGKMFGVLVVKTRSGEAGFLCAFSGMINGAWNQPGFVPPLCDQTILSSSRPDGSEELAILTQQIEQLEHSEQRQALRQTVNALEQQRQREIAAMKVLHQAAREQRRLERQALEQQDDPEHRQRALAVLANASKRHDREAVELRRHWRQQVEQAQLQHDAYEQRIQQRKDQRSAASLRLHRRLFDAYRLHNFLGEQRAMSECFPDGLPPGGSGDCAAPKLIHYACQHGLHPVAIAEFWWGASPSSGIRHHGQFYPACRGKCRPILPFMLRGLAVEAEPDHTEPIAADEPVSVYEDAHLLVVNKPAGLLSVPGRQCNDSVFSRLRARYPEHPELKPVHRLDLATSGLLVVAKNLQVYILLQQQFSGRTVEKRYEALLDGLLPDVPGQGEIHLPLRGDLHDRPRQMVCHQHGKRAQTRWQMIRREGDVSRVFFYPQTGRTHQLRVHASHRDGLNTPIVGDELYGRPGARMMLHAQRLCFTHPVSGQPMNFESVTPF